MSPVVMVGDRGRGVALLWPTEWSVGRPGRPVAGCIGGDQVGSGEAGDGDRTRIASVEAPGPAESHEQRLGRPASSVCEMPAVTVAAPSCAGLLA
jgi:hypothetical protein